MTKRRRTPSSRPIEGATRRLGGEESERGAELRDLEQGRPFGLERAQTEPKRTAPKRKKR